MDGLPPLDQLRDEHLLHQGKPVSVAGILADLPTTDCLSCGSPLETFLICHSDCCVASVIACSEHPLSVWSQIYYKDGFSGSYCFVNADKRFPPLHYTHDYEMTPAFRKFWADFGSFAIMRRINERRKQE